MKLLIYLLLLLTMPLAAQGKTDEKTLLDRIDKMIKTTNIIRESRKRN